MCFFDFTEFTMYCKLNHNMEIENAALQSLFHSLANVKFIKMTWTAVYYFPKGCM